MSRVIVVFTLISLLTPSTPLFSQANPRGKISSGDITIEYGRPSAKGRDVVELIAPGSYWRLGADDVTSLDTRSRLRVGDAVLPQGTYFLLARFTEGRSWKLVVCKDVGPGFTPKDTVAEATLNVERNQPHVERMAIDLKAEGDRYQFTLSWGTHRLSTSFSKG